MPQKTDQNILVLLLGGIGARFGSPLPKQFIDLVEPGTPLFLTTLDLLFKAISFNGAVLVVHNQFLTHPQLTQPLEQWRSEHPRFPIILTEGGKTRHQSFRQGLTATINHFPEANKIAVHDANRPRMGEHTLKEINHQITMLSPSYPCSIPVIPSSDSLVLVPEQKEIKHYLERDQVFRVQTPQLIYLPSLLDKLDQAGQMSQEYPDEGSFCKELGLKVSTFPGDASNIKITYQGEL